MSGGQGSTAWEVWAVLLAVALLGTVVDARSSWPVELVAVCWALCTLCTVAADGWARASSQPSRVLTHRLQWSLRSRCAALRCCCGRAARLVQGWGIVRWCQLTDVLKRPAPHVPC